MATDRIEEIAEECQASGMPLDNLLKPEAKFRLATIARPIVLLFVPATILMWAVGASFWIIVLWLVGFGLFGAITACPRCRQSIYWNERKPFLTLAGEAHGVCTRCGFAFEPNCNE
ncbi:hypothetical protein EUV02_15440 [Polymorphobacter arshaanensis]|uniref:Uncharacterized protein n=1 Tax=Glacieibacterium arshaanense TaxID=2511025 RepID=A0A4Y9EKN2_9SPHN|nr:hypothetical protein [Polymorphobacter arshaanensis]TFU00039.1 hypothetical protein EUV02_15440 [Polymorphobacter arshaanensis]